MSTKQYYYNEEDVAPGDATSVTLDVGENGARQGGVTVGVIVDGAKTFTISGSHDGTSWFASATTIAMGGAGSTMVWFAGTWRYWKATATAGTTDKIVFVA